VVDFVDVGSFPVFNVADSCITIGAILLAILLTRAELRGEAADERPGDDAEDGAEHAGR
jgi:signal peptidase II